MALIQSVRFTMDNGTPAEEAKVLAIAGDIPSIIILQSLLANSIIASRTSFGKASPENKGNFMSFTLLSRRRSTNVEVFTFDPMATVARLSVLLYSCIR